MNQTIEELQIKIGADIDEYIGATRKIERVSKRVDGRLSRLFTGVGRSVSKAAQSFVKLAGPLTAVVAAYASFSTVVQSMNRLDSLGKTADKLGVTTEALQGLRLAAELTGVETRTMDMALQRMVRRVAEAAQGTGEAVKALQEMNISAEELAAMSPDKQLGVIADAMQDVENQSDKVRLAMKLFDSEGVSLVNTLDDGSEALERVQEELREMGADMSRLDIRKVEAANDAIARMKVQLAAISDVIAVEISAPLEAFVKELGAMVKEFASGEDAVVSFGEVAETVFGAILDGIQGVATALLTMKRVGNALDLFKAEISGTDEEIQSALEEGVKLKEEFEELTELSASTRLNIRLQALEAERAARAMEEQAEAAEDVKAATVSQGMANVDILGGAEKIKEEDKKKQEELDREREHLQNKLSIVQDGLKSEAQLRVEAVEKQLETVRAARDQNLLTVEESMVLINQLQSQFNEAYQKLSLELNDLEESDRARRISHVEKMLGIDQRYVDASHRLWQSGAQGKASLMSDFFGNISTMMESENKKQFQIGKAAAIGQATVDTYLAATKAYQAMAGIPIVGPALGAAAAAAAVAAGVANINQIRSTSFGGGGGGGTSAGGAGAGVGGGGGGGSDGEGQPQIIQNSITLQGERFSADEVDQLIEEINQRSGDNVQLKVAR